MTEAQAYDLAYEEVVADSCESFLADGDAIAKIAELKAKEKRLWQTIKDFITKLVTRIKAAYEGLSPDTVEGRLTSEMLDAAEELKAMWTEMLVEASETENGVAVQPKGVKNSDRDFSYSELVAKNDLQGFVIGKVHQAPLKSNGLIDDNLVFSEVRKGCKTIQTNGGPVFTVDVPDIGRSVEVAKNGVTHSFTRPNDRKKGVPTANALVNARVALKIPDVLKNSIEVNRSQRGNNFDVPYTHVMMGTVALESNQGLLEYYAVRSMIQERENQNPILVEANVLGKLYATNVKKISTPTVQVAQKGVALADGDAYAYSIADFLQDVKWVFDNTFSQDVYQHLGVQRTSDEFSKNLLYSDRYQSADTNSDILSMVEKVEIGDFRANEKVDLGTVSDAAAAEIYNITGINVTGFKVAVEARQIHHIIKDHGKNGLTDKSMANPSDIAKIEFALEGYDDISAAGKTQAYTHMVNGKNRTADTVLYEKSIGEKAYYVVQAVPDTKAKTLYIVTAFIGKKGYKKEASQLINAKSPDVTAKTGSADTSIEIISHTDESVKSNFSDRDLDSVSNRTLLADALESTVKDEIERKRLTEYKEAITEIESAQEQLTELRAKIKEMSFATGPRDTKAINALRFEANKLANRISVLDGRLLRLESMGAIKGVLAREKARAYEKAKQEGKEALAAYRRRAEQKQKDLAARYQESRKKGVEGRRKTEMRLKIKGVVNELNQLLKNTKEKHVPIQLQKPVALALAAVNMDTVGAEEPAELQNDFIEKAA